MPTLSTSVTGLLLAARARPRKTSTPRKGLHEGRVRPRASAGLLERPSVRTMFPTGHRKSDRVELPLALVKLPGVDVPRVRDYLEARGSIGAASI